MTLPTPATGKTLNPDCPKSPANLSIILGIEDKNLAYVRLWFRAYRAPTFNKVLALTLLRARRSFDLFLSADSVSFHCVPFRPREEECEFQK